MPFSYTFSPSTFAMNVSRDQSEKVDLVVSYALRTLANLAGRWRRCPGKYPLSMVRAYIERSVTGLTNELTSNALSNCHDKRIRNEAELCLRNLVNLKASFDHGAHVDDIVGHIRAATATYGSLQDRQPIVVDGHVLDRDDSPSV